MRLLTFNAGLLDLRILGRSVIRPAGYIGERFTKLAPALTVLDADVVTLQEVYATAHKRELSAALRSHYPFVAESPLRGPSVVPASLLTFSKWPIEEHRFYRFQDMPIAERLIDNKGFLVAKLRSPSGPMWVANVHTTAGGTKHPEHPQTDAIRSRQLGQLLEVVKAEEPVVLTGDFNCGSVSRGNYEQLLEAGYSDVWANLLPEVSGWTWDPESVLNAGGTHTSWGCPAQRIDLILLNQGAARRWRPVSCRRAFTELDVAVEGGRAVTLSDHYGVLAEFDSDVA